VTHQQRTGEQSRISAWPDGNVLTTSNAHRSNRHTSLTYTLTTSTDY